MSINCLSSNSNSEQISLQQFKFLIQNENKRLNNGKLNNYTFIELLDKNMQPIKQLNDAEFKNQLIDEISNDSDYDFSSDYQHMMKVQKTECEKITFNENISHHDISPSPFFRKKKYVFSNNCNGVNIKNPFSSSSKSSFNKYNVENPFRSPIFEKARVLDGFQSTADIMNPKTED